MSFNFILVQFPPSVTAKCTIALFQWMLLTILMHYIAILLRIIIFCVADIAWVDRCGEGVFPWRHDEAGLGTHGGAEETVPDLVAPYPTPCPTHFTPAGSQLSTSGSHLQPLASGIQPLGPVSIVMCLTSTLLFPALNFVLLDMCFAQSCVK